MTADSPAFDPKVAIAKLDALIGQQLDAIFAHPELGELVRAWRSLEFLVERLDFDSGIGLEVLFCSKEELRADFTMHGGADGSALQSMVHRAMLRDHAGAPYSVLIGDFAIGPDEADIALLRDCASVAAMAHAPVLLAASPTLFGVESSADLNEPPGSWVAHFESASFAALRQLRERDIARYATLCLPRFSLDDGVWCHANIALATRVADSFAKYAWCPNILRVSGGLVEGVHLEVSLREPIRRQLTACGLSVMFANEALGEGRACFDDAPSQHQPAYFGDDLAAEQYHSDDWLNAQLPYVFIICRVVHYLRAVYVNHEQQWRQQDEEVWRGLARWLGHFTADASVMTDEERTRRPFRATKLTLEEHAEGRLSFVLKVRPLFKFHGMLFALQCHGMLTDAGAPRESDKPPRQRQPQPLRGSATSAPVYAAAAPTALPPLCHRGRHLGVSLGSHEAWLWDLSAAKPLRRFPSRGAGLVAATLSPDESALVTVDQHANTCVWQLHDSEEHRGGDERAVRINVSPLPLDVAGTSPLRRIVMLTPGRPLRAEHREEYRSPEQPAVVSAAWSQSGDKLATATADGRIALWDMSTGALDIELTSAAAILQIGLAPDAATLTAVTADGGGSLSVSVWDLHARRNSGALLSKVGLDGPLREAHLGAGGLISLEGTEQSGTLVHHDLRHGERRVLLEGALVTAAAVQPPAAGSEPLVAASSRDGWTKVWSLSDWQQRLHLEETTTTLAFDHAGEQLACVGGTFQRHVFGGRQRINYEAEPAHLHQLVYTHQAEAIAARGDGMSSVELWRRGEISHVLRGHGDALSNMAACIGRPLLATTSEDGTIRVWHLESGACCATIAPLPGGWVAYKPDGRCRITGNPEEHFWHCEGLRRAGVLEQLCVDAGQALDLAED